MALGTTNISILTVQNAIAVYSTSSLGALIALAQSNGIGGYAFYINETYGSTGYRNGYLINGAVLYWNRWSYNMPAEWDYSNGTMELRLKRNALNANGGYDFRLHDFRGYDHLAVQPQFSVASSFNAIGGAVTIEWLTHFHQIHLPDDITHILAKVTIGGQVQTVLMPLADITDSTPEISSYSSSFTGVSETSGTVQLYASNSQGTEVATLINIVSSKNFAVNHVAQYAYLARGVAFPYDPDANVVANITNPSGSGSIQIAAGTSQLTGIVIRVIGSSAVYSIVDFDLYLTMTGESNIYVGTYYAALGSTPENTDLYLDAITLNSAVAAGDNLGFITTNVTFS